MSIEWKGALRLQIEALAKRNDLHRRCNRESVQRRTKEMDQKIIKMRELLSTDANQAAQFYLECVCHADETERILNRTSSRDRRRKKDNGLRYVVSTRSAAPTIHSVPSTSAVELILPEALPKECQLPTHSHKWWAIHRKEQDYEDSRNEVRQLWKSQNDFVTHALSLVIGVGNVIRFPAAIYRSGGIFLIPYLILQLLIGFPLVFLHFSIGQFSGLGPAAAFPKLAPAALGLGWTFVLAAVPFSIYFNVYAGWSLFYLIQAIFTADVPWQHCDRNLTSSRTCCPTSDLESCRDQNSTVFSTETFIHSTELHVAGAYLGSIQPSSAACLAGAWLLTAVISLKSTPTLHFTSTFPFLVLLILTLCASSLPGAEIGLSYLFSIKLGKLFTLELWLLATEQVFFELGLCGGPMIALAALNRFRNNVFRDSAVVVGSSIIASMLSALMVFSFAGNVSFLSEVDISHLVAYDFRYFSYIVLPSMTSTVQAGSFWISLLFLTLTLATVDAQYAWLHLLVSSFLQKLGSKNKFLESRFIIGLCCIFFLLGLPFSTTGGTYLFHSFECLITTWSVSLLSLLLILLVFYNYGPSQFLSDVSMMLRSPLLTQWGRLTTTHDRIFFVCGPTGFFLRYCWVVFCPIFLVITFILFLVTREPIKFARNPVPWPYELTAWIVISLPLLAIPIGFFAKVFEARKNGKTFISLFDSSVWTQMEHPSYGSDIVEPEPPTSKKRRIAMRENTYMYIDPMSRGNTERSVTAIQIEDNYGWRVGRLREVQDDHSLQPSSSQPSFAASMTSQGTTNKAEIALFGSPPASNAFMLSEVIGARAAATRRQRAYSESTPSPVLNKDHHSLTHLAIDTYPKISSISEPPVVPCTPPPRGSPACRSEPPRAMTDRPSSSLRSKSSVRSKSDDYSDSDDEDGIRPQRITVIRRYCSEDSVGLQSNTSISITPIDRQRSLSSVAIYEQEAANSRPTQTLSQLKRPAPIDAPRPKSPTRF